MSFPRYPAYKPSGVEWLGPVPEHWQMKKMRHLSEAIEQGWSPQCENEPSKGDSPGVLKVGCVNGGRFRPMENKRLPDEIEPVLEYAIKRGDLLVSRANTRELVGCAAVALQDYPWLFICDKIYRLTLKTEEAIPSHVAAYLSSRQARGQIELGATGASQSMQNISQDVIRNLSIPLPCVKEQQAIANFLDRETAKIDALIAEQQRLIELLQEKRQAVISHAVTKGLNPNAPMKDSGVEWLGEVPEHWEVVQVRRITESHKQGFYSNEGYVEQGVNLLRITDIQDDASIDISESPKVDENSVPNEFLLEKGDFVFARTGGAGSHGFVDQLSSPTAFASYLIRFRFAASIEPGFLRLYFLSKLFLEGIASSIHGGVNQNVHAEDIKNQWLALAPKEEQQAIASKVFGVLDRYAALSSSIEDEIRLLNERRSALISAAVTGQIDVRVLVEAEDSEQ